MAPCAMLRTTPLVDGGLAQIVNQEALLALDTLTPPPPPVRTMVKPLKMTETTTTCSDKGVVYLRKHKHPYHPSRGFAIMAESVRLLGVRTAKSFQKKIDHIGCPEPLRKKFFNR